MSLMMIAGSKAFAADEHFHRARAHEMNAKPA
jgi:hypothetical protein